MSEKGRSVKTFCICLAVLLPKNQKKLRSKYLDPNSDLYHSLEPDVVSTLNNYNFKIKSTIDEIRSDAKSGLNNNAKILNDYIEIFDKNIKYNKRSSVLSKDCKSKLKKLCGDYLSNNVSFRDVCEDDFAEVLRRLR